MINFLPQICFSVLVFQVDCTEYKRNSKLSYFSIPFTDVFCATTTKNMWPQKNKVNIVIAYIYSHHHIYLMCPYEPILLCIYNNSYNPIIALSLKNFLFPFIKHLFVWVFCNMVDICDKCENLTYLV